MTAICFMTAGLSSCSSEEEVVNPAQQSVIDLSNCESLNVSVGIPEGDEIKTRAGQTSSFIYGTDGLWSFSRTIDHLWYAIYHKGNLLYHSMESGIPQAVYDASKKSFSLDIQIPKINGDIKLSDYSVFFMAGNALDKVATSEITDGIGLDFANKTMYAYPALLSRTKASGNMYTPEQSDYFVKYITLDNLMSGTKGNVTLIRPFCQVSLLTDELCQATVINALSNNGKVNVTATPYVSAQKIGAEANSLVYGWNYGTDTMLTKDASEIAFTHASIAYDNSLGSYTIPQVVTFKTRQMFCVASYLMLAPSAKKAYDTTAQKTQFGFNINVTGNIAGTPATVLADMPASSFKANEKYILYNKYHDPDDKNGGDGGIFSTHYALDIVVDPTWTGSNESEYK